MGGLDLDDIHGPLHSLNFPRQLVPGQNGKLHSFSASSCLVAQLLKAPDEDGLLVFVSYSITV